MSGSDTMLLERLRAIRTEVRRRLVLYGLCAVLSGGLLSFTTIVLLDWLLWLPPMLRVCGGVLFFAGFVWAAWHWIARPLQVPVSLNAVAGKLEGHFRVLGDSLSSAISFLESPGDGSPAMMRRVIDGAGQKAKAVPLESALTLRPLIMRGATLGVGVLLAGVIMSISPGWYATGLARYLNPYEAVEWPRTVEIVHEHGDMTVALGDAVTLKMRVTRGLTPDLRGVVKVRDAGGAVSGFAMQREGETDFYLTLDGIGGDLSYWFEAGDDSTENHPIRIAAVKRPVIVEAAARVEPPAYAQPREPVELDLSTGTVRATAGSGLTLSIRSSKPVGMNAEGRPAAWVEFGLDRSWPLEAVEGDTTRLAGTIPVEESGAFQIVLRDTDGFENQGRREYRLIVEPDQAPVVTVLEPAALTEVTPGGSVSVSLRAEDDFGIERIRLAGELLDGGRPVAVPVFDRGAGAEPTTSATERAVREIRRLWEIAPLGLRAGDTLVYRAEAEDNFAAEGNTGQKGSSQPLRLKVIGAAEFEDRLRDEFGALEKRVRESVAEQETLRDQVAPLARATDAAALTADQVELARRSGLRQYRLAQRVGETADRFARIAERMRLNQAFDEETRGQVADMTGRLRQTASATMTEAARALDGVEEAAGGEQQRERATLAEGKQAAAVSELQDVIRWMGRWGDFQEVVARTRDLLDRQQEVRAATLRQGVETVGAAVEALSDAQKAALRANMRDQQQLARDMEQWLRNAGAVKENVGSKDPAAAEAVSQALRLAGAQQILQRMENAAEAVGGNRTAGAALEQRAAEAGLASVLAALEARQARELAELKKTVERLVDAVGELLRQQEALLAANEEAAHLSAGIEAFERLSGEQRALRRNTQQLGDQAEGEAATNLVGRELEQAAIPMESAEQKLAPASSADAAVDQQEAVRRLKDVLEALEQLAAQTDHRLLQTSIAVTRRKLEEIREQQEDVNGQSSELVDVVRSQGRLDRAGSRRATRLAGRQTEIQTSVDALAREMEKAAVYGWVLEQVSGGMKTSGEGLAGRKLDDALIEGQREIVAQLRRLIDALATIQSLPLPDKFAEGQDGGGGEANERAQPPVPPVAELIVLKAMQESLRERTAAARKAWGEGEPGEADLQRAKRLGEEQERLRAMTEMVTQQARQGD